MLKPLFYIVVWTFNRVSLLLDIILVISWSYPFSTTTTSNSLSHHPRHCLLDAKNRIPILLTKTTATQNEVALVMIDCAGYIFWQLFLWRLYYANVANVSPLFLAFMRWRSCIPPSKTIKVGLTQSRTTPIWYTELGNSYLLHCLA